MSVTSFWIEVMVVYCVPFMGTCDLKLQISFVVVLLDKLFYGKLHCSVY